jgi:NTP pyrophosphatase (non-canonical NTP hydrolase)
MLTKEAMAELLAFRTERDWEQFHTPRNISASICIEASELLEIFQWAKDEDLKDIVEARREEVEFEVADLVMLLSYFCHDHNIDIEEVLRRKMVINKKKYPVEKSKGISTKYDRL